MGEYVTGTGVCDSAFFKFGKFNALSFGTKLMVPKRSGNVEEWVFNLYVLLIRKFVHVTLKYILCKVIENVVPLKFVLLFGGVETKLRAAIITFIM